MEQAISRGAEINKANRSRFCRTALHSAAEGNYPDVIRLLIKKGAMTSAKDILGSTALHVAALSENHKATSTLLSQGADMMCRDHSGNTPAHNSAAELGQKAPSGLSLFINAGFNPNIRGCRGRTILHVAAKYDSLDSVEYLLRQKKVGIPINARDSSGKTPLDYAGDPTSIAWAMVAKAEIVRLLTEATNQVEGGRDHTCLHGCYHSFSL